MKISFNVASPDRPVVDLEACLAQAQASKDWFSRRVLPLSVEQVSWRPDQRHWSIVEVLDHLNLTLLLHLSKIDVAIGQAWPQGWSSRRAESEFVKLMEPPVRMNFSAPNALLPPAAFDPDRLVSRFHLLRDRYADTVQRAFRLDLDTVLIAEPIYPLIRSLGATLALMAAHDRRHIWQAEQIRLERRFPKAFSAPATDQSQESL
jgi:hypothetical protein